MLGKWISFFGPSWPIFRGKLAGSFRECISQVTFRSPLTPSHQAARNLLKFEVDSTLDRKKIMQTENPQNFLAKKMNKNAQHWPGIPIRFRFERLWRRSSVRFAPLIPSSPGLEIWGGHFLGSELKNEKGHGFSLMGNHGMGGDLRHRFGY